MVDVARLRETDDGVHEHVRLVLTRRADGELAVRAVHRVAGLEGDDLAPCELLEVGAELSGRVAEVSVVEVSGGLDSLDLAADVVLLDLVAEVCDGRVRRVVSAEDLDSLLNLVRLVDVIDCEDTA